MPQTILVRDEVTPTLKLIDERLRDFTAPNDQILTIGLEDAAFDVEVSKGALFGRPWVPMAASTIKRGRDPATLEDEFGALIGSLQKGGGNNVFVVGPFDGSAGSDDPKIAAQHYGVPGVRLPARPILLWNEERFPEYDGILLSHVMGEGA